MGYTISPGPHRPKYGLYHLSTYLTYHYLHIVLLRAIFGAFREVVILLYQEACRCPCPPTWQVKQAGGMYLTLVSGLDNCNLLFPTIDIWCHHTLSLENPAADSESPPTRCHHSHNDIVTSQPGACVRIFSAPLVAAAPLQQQTCFSALLRALCMEACVEKQTAILFCFFSSAADERPRTSWARFRCRFSFLCNEAARPTHQSIP